MFDASVARFSNRLHVNREMDFWKGKKINKALLILLQKN